MNQLTEQPKSRGRVFISYDRAILNGTKKKKMVMKI